MSSWEEFQKRFTLSPILIDQLSRAVHKSSSKKSTDFRKSLEIEVTPEYRQIFDWLNAKAPIVFVTGKAGTGKTTFVRFLTENYPGNSVIVAPTGVAALQVGGVTIHSLFRFPPRIVIDDDIKLVRDRQLYRKIDLLIIDEISMVRADIIDAIDQFLQLNREIKEPFGGVQLLMVGDLFQLPPVVQQRDRDALRTMGYDSSFFFSAKVLKHCSMVSKELTKVYRQSQEEFIALLNRVRAAESLDEILPTLNERFQHKRNTNEIVITLTCTNKVADEINNDELKRLGSPLLTYIGETSGKFSLENEKLPSPLNLSLKVGAQIMFTKNDEKKRWVNGTLGRAIELSTDSIRIEVGDGDHKETHDVKPVKWESFKYEYDHNEDKIKPTSIGIYRQYPLMLAWAVTIHKSQGKTLEKVRLDLGEGAFDYGQVYVALSRCRSLEDIHLVKPVRKEDIKCNPAIKRFYEALSQQA